MEDLINRRDAIEVIEKMMEVYWDRKVVLARAWEQIKGLPSVNLQPTCNQLATNLQPIATDCISRQMAIDAILEMNTENRVSWLDCALDTLEALPSAEPRWIPVTERLPEIDMTFPHSERYFVQYEDGDMDVASWSNVNQFWTDHVTEPHWNCVQFQTVIAWMPLPEPWKGGADE